VELRSMEAVAALPCRRRRPLADLRARVSVHHRQSRCRSTVNLKARSGVGCGDRPTASWPLSGILYRAPPASWRSSRRYPLICRGAVSATADGVWAVG
jgi:hypothetical protein